MSKRNRSKKQSQYTPGRYFFAFPHALTDSPDYFNMTHGAIHLLHVMCRLFNGFNNGDISIPISLMKLRGWCASTLNDAKKELIKNNWIYETRKGGLNRCSLYAISFIPLNDCKNKLDIEKAVGFIARVFNKN